MGSGDNKIIFNNFIGNKHHVDVFENFMDYTICYSNSWTTKNRIAYTYDNKTCINHMGNYWDTYNGTGSNEDGIGDTFYEPHRIFLDKNPLMKPTWMYKILDQDNDGLNDIQEEIYNTNPMDPDTDKDGWNDYIEVLLGADPYNLMSNPWYFAFPFLIFSMIIVTLALLIIIILGKH